MSMRITIQGIEEVLEFLECVVGFKVQVVTRFWVLYNIEIVMFQQRIEGTLKPPLALYYCNRNLH